MSNKTICVIPARGGSKRVPRKNVLPLNGIPLLAYSIRAAKESGVFDKIVVSSEDKEIQEVALNEGVEIDNRPNFMAGDKVTKVQVIKEYIERMESEKEYTNIACLLPTCPFRTADDVKNAFDKFVSNPQIPFLIGVTEYEFPIQLALKKDNDLSMTMREKDSYQTTRSQNIEKHYHPNGAIYLASIEAFKKNGTFFNETMLTYEMPAIRSYDIDYPYQFEIAAILAKKIQNNEL